MGMVASRRGQAGSGAGGDGWVDRVGRFAKSPSHSLLLCDRGLLYGLSEPQVSQPPSWSPSRLCGRARGVAWRCGTPKRNKVQANTGWGPQFRPHIFTEMDQRACIQLCLCASISPCLGSGRTPSSSHSCPPGMGSSDVDTGPWSYMACICTRGLSTINTPQPSPELSLPDRNMAVTLL